ncbi:MAG: glycerophosphodiester phosphodiesterase [Nannocystaceae bacterium]
MRRAWPLALTLGLACAGAPAGDAGEDASDGGTSPTSTGEATSTSTSTITSTSTSTSESESDTEATTTTGGPAIDPAELLRSDRFLNIAHRGGGKLRPEETLIAYEHALMVGADVIEMDLHATADGAIVLMHDDTVERTTSGAGAIASMTLAELKALDAGYHFTPDGGRTFPYRGQGITVPTLDELLEALPGRVYLMEIKQTDPPIVDDVLAILHAHEVGTRVVIASFDTPTIEAVRAADPEIYTAMSLDEMVVLLDNLGNPDYAAPAPFVQSPWELSSAELVEWCHALGLKVHPWTVNSGAAMDDLIAREVDGIMTDDPVLLGAHAPAP